MAGLVRDEPCLETALHHNKEMASVTSESELLDCFRKIDRREVELSPDLALPLTVDDVFAWTVGPRAFLLLRNGPNDRPRGIVFGRNPGVMPTIIAMCDWCHSVRGHGAIKLMSVSIDKHRTIGVYLCSDLGCMARARELPTPNSASRTLTRIREFASRCVF